MNTYQNFDVLFSRLFSQRYQAQVIQSPAGEARAEFSVPFTRTERARFLKALRLEIKSPGTMAGGAAPAIQDFGRRLYDCVFGGPLGECLTASLPRFEHDSTAGLRIRLRLANVPELAELPWEFLYHPQLDRFLGLSSETPIVRYPDLLGRVDTLLTPPPIRVLGVIANPVELLQLDTHLERQKIQEALNPLIQQGLVTVEWLDPPTLEAFTNRLRGDPIHIFHFIGHGNWVSHSQTGHLFFERSNRTIQFVSDHALATLLHDQRFLRLVVLNACESAGAATTNVFTGLAGKLVSQEVPAVVAMRFAIADQTAILLSRVFYESLADNFPVEAALTEARKAVFAAGATVEWAVPVLHLRSHDGQLFHVTRGTTAQAQAASSTRTKLLNLNGPDQLYLVRVIDQRILLKARPPEEGTAEIRFDNIRMAAELSLMGVSDAHPMIQESRSILERDNWRITQIQLNNTTIDESQPVSEGELKTRLLKLNRPTASYRVIQVGYRIQVTTVPLSTYLLEIQFDSTTHRCHFIEIGVIGDRQIWADAQRVIDHAGWAIAQRPFNK